MLRGRWELGHLRAEVQLLEELRHPNLTIYLGADIINEDVRGEPPLLAVVTEYCPNGSLYDALHPEQAGRSGAAPLAHVGRLRCARQIGSAVQMLHCHRPSPVCPPLTTSCHCPPPPPPGPPPDSCIAAKLCGAAGLTESLYLHDSS
jgi:serine/threonine protein kinase